MRVCSGSGCLRVVADDVRFCDECQPPQAQESDGIKEHSNAYDALLDSLRKGTRWQKIRALVIRQQPLCARCERAISEIADHIVPAAVAVAQAQASGRYRGDRYAGYYLRSNLQGLCRQCHGVKTLEDKAHAGPWADVVAIEAAAPKRRWSFG